MQFKLKGNLVDAYSKRIFPAEVIIVNGKIDSISESKGKYSHYILPGLVDSHVHIESSMLSPSGFAYLAVKHGTVAVVSDPHEIANVAGIEGVCYMTDSAETVPLKFYFGAPSCVPATEFETSGARLDPEDVKNLLNKDNIFFLSEVMNYPGVIYNEENIMQKIDLARKLNKPIDGHAPGLTGDGLLTYANAGITTDHECLNINEAEEKISAGIKIQIREGSAAKGFDNLFELIDKYPESVMLCSDDMHPDDLIAGHINILLSRGVKKGVNIFNLIKAASINPVLHYNLSAGLLREGDNADFIIVKDLKNFDVLETYIDGNKVFEKGNVLFNPVKKDFIKSFRTLHLNSEEIQIFAETDKIKIIKVKDGELYTGSDIIKATVKDRFVVADASRDICKIVVVNKYGNYKPSVGFVSGFGLRNGAMAGSVAHDSHNIVAVGVEDKYIVEAVNSVIDMQGGLVAVSDFGKKFLQLEIAGLMTNNEGEEVARSYKLLDKYVKKMGSGLSAPFMSLSFMALLVIPELKIGDKGLFDVNEFSFTPLFIK
ncbi:MAG: adenine deaminase [Bacteroidales bacterium]